MRHLLLPLAALLLYVPSAFAIKDLMSLCERRLSVNKDLEIQLAADQIALSGNLNTYWDQSMEGDIGWIMVDDFIRRRISPQGQDYVHWLTQGDFVYILDPNGAVIASGYYGERREPRISAMGFLAMPFTTNCPYLFHDPELTQIATPTETLRNYFKSSARAVVVKTLPEANLKALQERLGPSFQRFEINRTHDDRFVRVGRRRAYELAHFQTAMFGKATVAHRKEQAQMVDIQTGEITAGPEFFVFKYETLSGAAAEALKDGDYLMLLNERGEVTAEGSVGGPLFPWYTRDEDLVKSITAKFSGAHSAFIAKIKLRKLE